VLVDNSKAGYTTKELATILHAYSCDSGHLILF